MQQIKSGDKVKVHYHGKLTSGETFDSSEGREPLEFTVGQGQVIKGFDNALIDMAVGEKKTVEIPVVDAYGDRRDDMVVDYPKEQFPQEMTPEVGMQLNMSDNQGNNFPVVITEIKDETVVLDANHPLAGKDLVFDLEVVEIA